MRCFMLLTSAAMLASLSSSAAAGQDGPIAGLSAQQVTMPDEMGDVADLGPLVFRGGLSITTPDPKFVGWSGIWVSPDGAEMVGVERGTWVKARLEYDPEGNLSGFVPERVGMLHDANGNALSGDEADAEGLDFDGTDFFVGFETHDRVLRYRDIDGPGVALPIPQAVLAPIFRGAGFSSVAALPNGSVMMMPEYSYASVEQKERGERPSFAPTRGWIEGVEGAGPIALRAGHPALPVSITQLPSGGLVTSEVHFSEETQTLDEGRIGFVPQGEAAIGRTMSPRPIATFASPMPAWRIEGGSARTGARGETLLYFMSTSAPPVLYMFELKGGGANP